MNPSVRSLWRAVPLLLVAVALPQAGAARAQTFEVEPTLLALRSASRLWIEGRSNLLPWSCNAHSVRMEVTLSEPPSRGSNSCTEPLPKDFAPIRVAV